MEKFQETNQRDASNSAVIEVANHILNKHRNFYEELQGDE